jgi:hypothetical protein
MTANRLVERVVRNDDIYCSLLFDHDSRTLRVVDFFGGNFKIKQNYLDQVLIDEGMRKVFTLIELAEVAGWRRIGYLREGTIPGYYKRSDAHIMSRIYDEDWSGSPGREAIDQRSSFLAGVAAGGNELAAQPVGAIESELAESPAARAAIRAELARLRAKSTHNKRAPGKRARPAPVPRGASPLFRQFNRNTECYYWIAQHRRTKQRNVFGVEYQDCFCNAKINMYFTPDTRTGRTVARKGLGDFVDWLDALGAVAIFALVRADDLEQNTIYAAAGFQNAGWLSRQLLTNGSAVDQVLWTRKLTGFTRYGASVK